jgi:hypothetical protein
MRNTQQADAANCCHAWTTQHSQPGPLPCITVMSDFTAMVVSLSPEDPAPVFVVAVVTLGQWDPHHCNRSATVSYTPGTAKLAGTATHN